MNSRIARNTTAGLLFAIACANGQPALRDAFKDYFLVGAALNPSQFSEANPVQTELIKKQFNSITPENVLKWERIHPRPGEYDFGPGDRYVEFGQKHQMVIIGHTLIWHSQTPRWVFEENGAPASRETLLDRMREHIRTVVGRYRGRIKGWDVVNEALNEDGTLRASPWFKIFGEDYLAKAFEFAHEADPAAELYYNDFSLENDPKRKGAVALVRKLQAQGVPIHGLGSQTHARLDWPTPILMDEMLTEFEKLGVKLLITEFDLDVLPSPGRNRTAEVGLRYAANPAFNPYTNGLPAAVQAKLTARYAELFAVLVKHHRSIERVTFWGVSDGDSWLNNWPIRGRTNHPLLFDRDNQPKPAFAAVIKAASLARPGP